MMRFSWAVREAKLKTNLLRASWAEGKGGGCVY